MKRTLIQNAVVVNEGRKVPGSVVIEGEKLAETGYIVTFGNEPSYPETV